MSQRLNISIPDDLKYQLDSLKSKFNVSKICTNAIRKELQFYLMQDQLVNSGYTPEQIKQFKAKAIT